MMKFFFEHNFWKMEFILIVFDVDGVLVDTSRSFPAAIAKSITHYGQICGISFDKFLVREDVRTFKTVPGYNNDWDLDEALLIFYLQKQFLESPLNLTQFLRETCRLDVGLAGIKMWLHRLPSPERKNIITLYRPDLLRKLAMEYYAGAKYCEFLYGLFPRYGVKAGTLELEKSLIDTEILSQLQYDFGVYSGRNVKEFELVKDKIGYKYFRQDCLACDNGFLPRKPDPEPLFKMTKKCNSRGLIYVGDSRDDLETFVNFRKKYPDIKSEFVQVLNGSVPFREDISVIENVNQLLKIMGSVKS